MTNKILLSVFAVLCAAKVASASPILLQVGIPLVFDFSGAEQIDLTGANTIVTPGGLGTPDTDGIWGVLKVAQIAIGTVSTPHESISTGGPTIFTDQAQGQVTGVFYDIRLLSPTTATGGILDLYWNDPGVNVVGVPDTYTPDAGTVSAFSTGTFLGRLVFQGGIQNNNMVTLMSDVNLSTSIVGSGNAQAFASVDMAAGGDWAAALNGDWFFVDTDNDGIKGGPGETRDIRFSNVFNLTPGWDGSTTGCATGVAPCVKGFTHEDPATVLTEQVSDAQVPEPSSLVLCGLGLLGVAARRRKKAAKT